MSAEKSNYEACIKKLEGLCDEHDLTYSVFDDRYPISLVIRPVGGLAEQLSMLAEADEKGYTSPDAYIRFEFKDGKITYRMSKEFTITETLFNKIKNLFKAMHYAWLQHFHRTVMEHQLLTGALPDTDDEAAADAEPLEGFEDPDEDDAGDEPDSDELLEEAARIVRMENRCDTLLLQQRLKIGYHRAARLIDELELHCVVGPRIGNQPREILPIDEPDDADEE